MQLSKREFSKLSKKDQTMLQNRKQPKSKQQKSRKPQRQNQSSGPKLYSGEATGVAAAYSKGVKGNKPVITRSSNGESIRVKHKEFVDNVVGTADFTVAEAIALNPGLVASFPWLASIANNYEQYRVNMMKFCYLTRTGTNVPGSVLMAPDYDAADSPPSSEVIMSNYQNISEDAPWKDNCCVLSPTAMHSLGPKKFVRNSDVSSTDIKTYDVGNFFLATVDGTAVNWGKLWVEYDISFFVPQLSPNGPSSTALGGSIQGGGTQNAANPLGTGSTASGGFKGFTVTNSVITFTALGTFLMVVELTGTVITDVIETLSPNIALSGDRDVILADGTEAESRVTFNVSALPATVTITATATSVTGATVFIGEGPPGSFVN